MKKRKIKNNIVRSVLFGEKSRSSGGDSSLFLSLLFFFFFFFFFLSLFLCW